MPVLGACHLSLGINQSPQPYYTTNEERDRREAGRTTVASFWTTLHSLVPLRISRVHRHSTYCSILAIGGRGSDTNQTNLYIRKCADTSLPSLNPQPNSTRNAGVMLWSMGPVAMSETEWTALLLVVHSPVSEGAQREANQASARLFLHRLWLWGVWVEPKPKSKLEALSRHYHAF